MAAGPGVLFRMAILSDHDPDASGSLCSTSCRADWYVGRLGRHGSADVPLIAGFSEGSAGLREQSRRYRGHSRGIGLAHPASAIRSQSRLLVSDGRRATTRYAEYLPLAQ